MKELISSCKPLVNKIPYKIASLYVFPRPCPTETVIIKNTSLWLLLKISGSQAKVKKRKLIKTKTDDEKDDTSFLNKNWKKKELKRYGSSWNYNGNECIFIINIGSIGDADWKTNGVLEYFRCMVILQNTTAIAAFLISTMLFIK